MNTNTLRVYTDGSCPKPGGPGGAAAVFIYPDEWGLKEDVKLDGAYDTTNNRMELLAGIVALEHTRTFCQLFAPFEMWITSDSQWFLYSSGIVREQKLWRRSKNLDLWAEWDTMLEKVKAAGVTVRGRWVKGHNGNYYNELADRHAAAETERFAKLLRGLT